MSESDEGRARPKVTDVPCPACGAAAGEPCTIGLSGVQPTGWSHDARILAPIAEYLRTRTAPTEPTP